MSSIEDIKKTVGYRAADMVENGNIVGLGTGSTAYFAIKRLGQRVKKENLKIHGIPTSISSEKLALKENIPLADLSEYKVVDITIDGADEVDPMKNLIKGLGGALLREKIVASSTLKEIIIVDETKLVRTLGEKAPLPVEVIKFGWKRTAERIADIGLQPIIRMKNDGPFITDEGNYILDCHLNEESLAPLEISSKLGNIVGVIENGFFGGMTDTVIVGKSDGKIEMMESQL